jgi:hypothetical protein
VPSTRAEEDSVRSDTISMKSVFEKCLDKKKLQVEALPTWREGEAVNLSAHTASRLRACGMFRRMRPVEEAEKNFHNTRRN